MSALDEALQVIKTTAPQYFKEATDHTIRGRLVLAMMESQGNIVMNYKAPKFIWTVTVREPKARVITGGNGHTFTNTDTEETLEIDHKEFEVTEALPRRTQMINSNSPNALVDLAGEKLDKCLKTATRTLNKFFFADNSSGVNVGKPTGIKSFIKPGTAAAPDIVVLPASGTTYAGKSIELASLGGYWSTDLAVPPSAAAATDWPWGSGSSEYDWNTPKMFRVNGTFNGSTGWANNCLKVLRRSAAVLKSATGEGGAPVAQLLGLQLYSEVEDKLEERERTRVSDYAKSLGFPDVLTYGDAVLMKDFDCPSREGYGINPNECCLYSVHDQLFLTDTSWESLHQMSTFLAGFLGNYAWTPRSTAAYIEVTA
jgi:hypothetical protein